MKDERLRKRRAGWIEIGAWSTGGLLLASYGGVRVWSELARDEGIDAFQRAQQIQQEYDETRQDTVAARVLRFDESTSPETLETGEPDTRKWSASRIAEYLSSSNAPGMPEAVLRIDALGLEVPVYSGTSEWNLNRGAGIIQGTSPVAAMGNTGIAAHRDGYFRALKDVRLGEEVLLQTQNGEVNYRVTGIQVVAPDRVEVLAPTEQPSLTLVTCYPFYHVGPAPERFIVRAEQIPEEPPAIRRASIRSAQLAANRDPGPQEDQQGAAQTD